MNSMESKEVNVSFIGNVKTAWFGWNNNHYIDIVNAGLADM
jgi:hypothetical protein